MFRPRLSVLLSFNAGYVDTMGFLALAGLFTAHVTGNFVTLGASLAFGSTGVISKLLALPMFCVVVVLTRLLVLYLKKEELHTIRILMGIKLVLFTGAAIFALVHGPFRDGNSGAAIGIGMVLVTAMAVQNTLHRAHLPSLPPTTLMTGTTTQIMLDLGELIAGVSGEKRKTIVGRMKKMSLSLMGFAVGCAAGALFYVFNETWCFVVPPLLILLSFFARNEQLEIH